MARQYIDDGTNPMQDFRPARREGKTDRMLRELNDKLNAAIARAERAEAALKMIQDFVDDQAEDEVLWAVPVEGKQPISEAYIQQELRRLHSVIEQCAAYDKAVKGE